MTQRYYCPAATANAQDVTLQGSEAHHLANVMRAAPGDCVVLFDGQGGECDASVTAVGKREVRLQIQSRRQVNRAADVDLTLAVALPKGERQRWLVEKATELGVARLIPIHTQRSVVALKPAGVERLKRFVVEASKQCRRNHLMEIGDPIDWRQLIATTAHDSQRLLAHPADDDHQPAGTDWQVRASLNDKPIIAAVGPEGGFTDEEAQAAIAAGWRQVSLGPRILRVETAALALAALLLVD